MFDLAENSDLRSKNKFQLNVNYETNNDLIGIKHFNCIERIILKA